jgi:hypothetical protein
MSESDYEDNLCEWNKDSIYRDYCLRLKEYNNLYCKEHIEEDTNNSFGLIYIKDILYIEKRLNEDIYINYISDIVNIENSFIKKIIKDPNK